MGHHREIARGKNREGRLKIDAGREASVRRDHDHRAIGKLALEGGNNLDALSRLVVSDYGKPTAVAGQENAPPGEGQLDWRLGNVAAATNDLTEAAKRTSYERLALLAYPVM